MKLRIYIIWFFVLIALLLLGLTSVSVNPASTPSSCNSTQWTCDDGSCIDPKLKCNGALDCPDESDETFPLCRTNKCAGFKCVYGGCVASNVTCDGVRDCADGSDELLFKCQNKTTYEECMDNISHREKNRLEKVKDCKRMLRTCKNGQVLQHKQKCDGKVDCEDGSDETLETCATDERRCDTLINGVQFRCKYGACIDQATVCDGVNNCLDGSDELDGICNQDNEGKWECDDGTSIDAKLKCNGAVDCPDGSDETFLLCRNNECPLGFRCVYGGCINNSATCNGVKDCVDNSDELLAKCRNETTAQECLNKMAFLNLDILDYLPRMNTCIVSDKKCDNGQELEHFRLKCDGRVHCDDGSDESLQNCATDRHYCLLINSFRCQHGGCIDKSKVCNKIRDCADGSDELDEMCNKGQCVLPEYPEHGNYTVVDKPKAYPGQALRSVVLDYNCDPGYKHNGKLPYVLCSTGSWADDPLKCIIQCNLDKDPSIVFWCLSNGSLSLNDATECGEQVPKGTLVIPECQQPNYYYPEGVLSYMTCGNGSWDRAVPSCSPRCGLVNPEGDKLVIDGVSAERGKLPWHAGIYNKQTKPYEQICGGSLITDTIILSAAHCFWSDLENLLPAKNYAVALGKIYRPWNEKNDVDAQKSEVQEIIIPPYFRGSKASFQNDIALVVLTTRLKYSAYVRPVCLDFNSNFEQTQLKVGESGMVAGWGLTAQDGKASPVLKVTQLPYVDINRCYKESPPAFYMYITSDKFCAGNYNSSTLCQGDSGGGLVFSTRERNQERYYLRGVVSTKPQNNHHCNAYAHTTFTQVSKHQAFIQDNWR